MINLLKKLKYNSYKSVHKVIKILFYITLSCNFFFNTSLAAENITCNETAEKTQ